MIQSAIKKLKNVIKGDFFHNVTVLMSGTAIAQGLAFAASPILSRLYDPASFGLLGLFTAVTSIVSVAACAKYELAILLPKKDEDAANILSLSMLIILLVVVITFLIVVFFRIQIAELMGSPELAPLLWWAPVSILFTGLYKAYNFWSTRRKKYKRLSVSRVIQTSGREGTQLGLGFSTNLQGSGLVFGHVFGQACSAAALMAQTYREDYKLIRNSFNAAKLQVLAKKHIDFPKYNAPQDVLNSISQNVPAILLAYFFSPAVVGLYWFTHRILVAPNKLIGNSVRQVFYQQASEMVNKGKSVLGLFLKTTGGLAIVGIVPLMGLIFFAPVLFEFIFGNEWNEAGKYARWMSIFWFFQFINPPSIMLTAIFNKQKFLFKIEAIFLVLKAIGIIIGGIYQIVLLSIQLYSIVTAIFYFLIILYMTNYIWLSFEE